MIDKTDITMLLDRSGSMSLIRWATIDSFNKFINEQKLLNKPTQVTLYQFNDTLKFSYSHPLDKVPALTGEDFDINGSTALYDALKKVIDETGARLSNTPEQDRPDKVIVLVLTDGEENCSETTLSHVNDMVKHQKEKYSWDFVFVGINELGEKATNHFARSVGTNNIQTKDIRMINGETPEQQVSTSFKTLSQKMSEYRVCKKSQFYS